MKFKIETMKSNLFTAAISMVFLLVFMGVSAQEEVVLTVEGEKVTKADFESIFRKNNRDSVITKESLDEYLELFINFKLKVKEAKELGLDTNQAFIKELAGYRKQLARPYLVDSDLLDALIKTAYERKKTEIRASHILVKLDVNATADDTLKAWNKAISFRNKLVKGADFADVAKGKAGSDDPSAANNGGDLGYFSVFQMVYPFEEAVFNLEIGEISQPVRTRYGYHIVKVTDRRPARGEVEVAHLLINVKNTMNQEEVAAGEKKIREIYQQIKDGAEFGEMALRHSEDRSTAKDGGKLPFFGTGKMVEPFEVAAFGVSVGEVSEPFLTQYGWHIIKGLDKRPVPSFEELESDIKTRVSRDSRAELTTSSFLNKLKKEYNVQSYPKVLNKLVQAADSNIWDGSLVVSEKIMSETLLSIAGKNYSTTEFINYLKGRKQNRKRTPDRIVRDKFSEWEESTLMDYEDSKLESKHNAFRLLMNEYRDGILLFELTDQKVWSKAVQDSTGLAAFYNEHKMDYMWPERYNATIYSCANPEIAKQLRKLLKKKKGMDVIKSTLNAKSELNVKIDEGMFTLEDREILAKVSKSKGLSDNIDFNGQTCIVNVKEFLSPQPKKLTEAKGLVTADYQKFLEQEWIKELRKKYSFQANEKVLHSIR